MSSNYPKAFEHLREFAFHAANRAWAGLGHFFVAQSILALAWAALMQAPTFPFRPLVLVCISTGGVVMGFQWAMLGTRMWHYHLLYVGQMRKMWEAFRVEEHGVGATAWKEIDQEIVKHWRTGAALNRLKLVSSNQFVLLYSPMVLSAVHLVMLTVILWNLGDWWRFAAIAAAVVICIGFAAVLAACKAIIEGAEP